VSLIRDREALKVISAACVGIAELLGSIKSPHRSETLHELYKAFERDTGLSFGDPIALSDQEQAAQREALHMLASLDDADLGERDDSADPLRQGRMVAAIIRCLAHSCEHARPGSKPLIAFVGPRVLTCKDCLPRFRGDVQSYDAHVANDTLCDLCLAESDFFFRFATAFNGVLLLGDMCLDCNERVP